jgi:glycosyltransferase involved in cell wall biosynthesis
VTTPGSVRVSIGMPVFNMERTVARAIESVLAQTFTDFELVVSDNASQDGTEQVCRRYAEREARIRYTRQPDAISAFDNFRFVLDAARAPYFMWLAADDYVLPRLLERGVGVLDSRPDVVCAVPQVEFLDADGRRWAGAGSFALLGSHRENLCRFLRDPRDNSRFYGLYRRHAVRRVLPDSAYYGFDWVVAAGTLLYGKHAELPEVLLVREASDPLKYMQLVDVVASGRLDRLLPLARFTRTLLTELRVPPYPCVLYALLRINAVHHVLYCRYRYPRYGRLAHRLALGFERLGM